MTPSRIRLGATRMLTLMLAFASSLWADDWPTFQHDVHRTGATAESLPGVSSVSRGAAESLGPVWIWRGSERPRTAWAGPAKWDAYAGIRDLPAMRDYDSVLHVVAAQLFGMVHSHI